MEETKIKNLIEKWERDLKTYPSTDGDAEKYARTTLICCIRELRELYDSLEDET